jgi:hypothetical protein
VAIFGRLTDQGEASVRTWLMASFLFFLALFAKAKWFCWGIASALALTWPSARAVVTKRPPRRNVKEIDAAEPLPLELPFRSRYLIHVLDFTWLVTRTRAFVVPQLSHIAHRQYRDSLKARHQPDWDRCLLPIIQAASQRGVRQELLPGARRALQCQPLLKSDVIVA